MPASGAFWFFLFFFWRERKRANVETRFSDHFWHIESRRAHVTAVYADGVFLVFAQRRGRCWLLRGPEYSSPSSKRFFFFKKSLILTLISTCQVVRCHGDCLFCLWFVTSATSTLYYSQRPFWREGTRGRREPGWGKTENYSNKCFIHNKEVTLCHCLPLPTSFLTRVST